MTWVIGATAVACAMMGGIFFAFSSFVMPALGRIPATEGVHAMQRINIDVYHWSFMAAFLGTPLACLVVAANGIWHWGEPGGFYAVVGCAVYLVGTFLVTAAGNVPLNNALAVVDTGIVDAGRAWSTFAPAWVRWNHLRTFAALVAAGWFVAALAARSSG